MKKVIIFGEAGVGKTSTILTSFFNYPFESTVKLKPTKGISIESIKFRGLVDVSIWDCAGQDKYMSQHFSETGKMKIFSEIDVPVFIMDASREETLNPDFVDKFLNIVREYNPDIDKVYIFVNKMDIAAGNINDFLMSMTDGIISKWQNGFVEIINCSVKLGTTRRQFIQILDAVMHKDKEALDRQEFFRDCLRDFKEVVDGDFAIFHIPSLMMTASTLSDDTHWIGDEEDIIQKVIDVKAAYESMYSDTLICEKNGMMIIINIINNQSLLLTMVDADKVSNPDELLKQLRDHVTFCDLDKIMCK